MDDLGAHRPQYLGHDRHVTYDRDVVETVPTRGEQTGRHQL